MTTLATFRLPTRVGLGLLLCLAGCGSAKNRLFGSVSEAYNLDFDSVQASTVGEYLVIEYLKGGGKVAKLAVNLTGLTVQPGQEIDLKATVGSGVRGTLQRIVEATIELPIERGTLVLDQTPTAGGLLSGRFRTTLSSPSGRTLNGDFEAKLTALAAATAALSCDRLVSGRSG